MQKTRKYDGLIAAQLILSLLVVAASWTLAGGMLLFCVFSVLTKGVDPGELLQVLMLSCALAAVGLFLLPSGYYALMEMLGRPAPDSRRLIARLKPGLWIFALPVVILLGHWIAQKPGLAWLFLPPLHLLAVGIPTAWIVYLGIHRLPTGSSRQMWGGFGSGLSIGPALIMILEVLAAVGLLIIAVMYLFTQPEMMERITELALSLGGVVDQEKAVEIVSPYLVRPAVIGIVLLFVALIVPMIEELFKPIGVWLLAGSSPSPAAGFAVGALSGGGYAFIESLMLSGTAEQWSAAVLARAGTTAVHILTAALTGWALVQAWQKREYLRLLLVYLLAVLIHGLWNGLTLLFSFQMLAELQDLTLDLPYFQLIRYIAPAGLVLLAAGCFLGLIGANKILQAKPVLIVEAEVEDGVAEQAGESML